MQDMVTINQVPHDLEKVLQDCWHRLVRGANDPKHSFHCPAIATLNGASPELRTVVLRKVMPQEKTLIFYTDYRSSKIAQIKANHTISWLFYDPRPRIQLRLKTVATIHYQDEISLKRWNDSRPESRMCYLAAPAPSTVMGHPTDGLPEHLDRANLTGESVALGYENFAVISNVITEMDWLILNRDGHRRAQFIFGEPEVKKYWVVP